MKKYRLLGILLIMVSLFIVTRVQAHDVNTDPDNIIQLPAVTSMSGLTNFGLPIEVDEKFGEYKMYYQFVKMTDKEYSEYLTLIEEQENTDDESEKEEYDASIKDIKPSYDDNSWIETTNDTALFDVSKNDVENEKDTPYVLWVKITTLDKKTEVYDEQVFVYKYSEESDNGQGSITDKPNNENKEESPETGDEMFILGAIALAAMGVMVVSYKKSRA